MREGLRTRQGGSGEPLLVLLHGLGATGDVWAGWEPLLARRWPGRWIAPDLPGHGGSPPLAAYTFDGLAAAIAGAVADAVGGPNAGAGPVAGLDADGGAVAGPGAGAGVAGGPVVVLGHSLGGVVALALAGGASPLPVRAVVGLGIKVAWAGEELDKAGALARKPPAWFGTRDEAVARYLRVSGLAGLLAASDPAVDPGLREQDGRWRLAMDPGAFAVGAPDMADLLARSRAPVVLARGERDPMNTDGQLAGLGARTITLPGVGHNAHVENPELSATLLDAIIRPEPPFC